MAPDPVFSRTALSSVLTYSDMIISPDGEPVPVDRRLAEIHDRYSQGTTW
jgi:hypothetical protein